MGGGRRYSIEEKTEIPMWWKQIDGTKPEDVRKPELNNPSSFQGSTLLTPAPPTA